MKDGIRIGIVGVLLALGLFVPVYFFLCVYWEERDNYEKQEIDHYKSTAYEVSIFYLCLAVLLGVAAIVALVLFTYIIYDTAKTKWLRRRRLRELGLEFKRRFDVHRLRRLQQASGEQVADKKDANEQVADEENANEQVADEENANEQVADEENANEHVADEEANEQFRDEEHNV